eukprot:3680428-Rhodomonas_salina.2
MHPRRELCGVDRGSATTSLPGSPQINASKRMLLHLQYQVSLSRVQYQHCELLLCAKPKRLLSA